jgi:hypothetical protein
MSTLNLPAVAALMLFAASSQAGTGLLSGRIEAQADAVPLVVVAVDRDTHRIVHRLFLEQARVFRLPLQPGNYRLYAFADADRDGALDPDEARSDRYLLATRLRAGDRLELPTLRVRR